MTDLAIQDLEAYKHLLEPKIATFYPNMKNCTIQEPTDSPTYLCSCGCGSNPIASLLVSLESPPKVKKYGVLIFPTPTCIPAISNIDGKGYIIKVQMYEEICKWIKGIPRPLERQQKRTDKIKLELIEKTSPIFYDYTKM
jgi:hypothetical protein